MTASETVKPERQPRRGVPFYTFVKESVAKRLPRRKKSPATTELPSTQTHIVEQVKQKVGSAKLQNVEITDSGIFGEVNNMRVMIQLGNDGGINPVGD